MLRNNQMQTVTSQSDQIPAKVEVVGARCAYITATILLGAVTQCGTLRLTNYDITCAICVASACHTIAVLDNGTVAGDMLCSL